MHTDHSSLVQSQAYEITHSEDQLQVTNYEYSVPGNPVTKKEKAKSNTLVFHYFLMIIQTTTVMDHEPVIYVKP